jgi:hypothetical protein
VLKISYPSQTNMPPYPPSTDGTYPHLKIQSAT